MPEKILIVDDDIDTLRLVGLMLERQGYQIVAASNGRQALALAQSEQPDLILLDVMMPDLDGYEVTKQLRADPATGFVPIIMFTAKAQVDDKLMGFEAGVDDYLTKPTQPRELFAHVRAVLARSGKVRQVAPAPDRGLTIGLLAVKGGLGVTTLALNLAIALFQQVHKEVILAEFRPGQGSLCLELGYPKAEGLTRLLQRKAPEINGRLIESELVSHASGIRLLLSSPLPRDAQFMTATTMFEAIARQLPLLARFVLLDLGPGLPPLTDRVLPLCDEVIVVVEPHPNTVAHTKILIQELIEKGIGEGRMKIVLINRTRSDVQLSFTQVQERLGFNVATVFTPVPELAYQASARNVPLLLQQPEGLSAELYAKLAAKFHERVQQPG
jgi:CheY-like chemotaxis protein